MSVVNTLLSAFRSAVAGQVVSVNNLLIGEMADQERVRLQKIADAWDAYAGKLPKPLKVTRSDKDGRDNVLLNLAAPIVDTGVSFLVGKGVQFEVDGKTESDSDTWLTKCLKANKFSSKLQLLALNGGVCGDVFVRMLLPEPGLCGGYPRLVVCDPGSVDVVWSPDDFESIQQYKIQWNGVDPVSKQACAYRQLITRADNAWTIQQQKSPESSKTWVNDGAAVSWAFPWAPMFHCQNLPAAGSYYGVSDLEEHVVSVNNAINFVVSNMARIIRIHAHPKTWGSGIVAKELQIGIDETLLFAGKDAKLQNLEMLTDLGSSLELLKRLKEVLHEIARVPEVATGKLDGVGQLSGLAMQILFQSIVQKTDVKRIFYGDMLNDLAQRLLELGGQGADHDIVVKWPDVLPSDPAQSIVSLEADQRMGIVSRDTLATKRGYDFNTEKPKIAKEQQEAAAQQAVIGDNGEQGN